MKIIDKKLATDVEQQKVLNWGTLHRFLCFRKVEFLPRSRTGKLLLL